MAGPGVPRRRLPACAMELSARPGLHPVRYVVDLDEPPDLSGVVRVQYVGEGRRSQAVRRPRDQDDLIPRSDVTGTVDAKIDPEAAGPVELLDESCIPHSDPQLEAG